MIKNFFFENRGVYEIMWKIIVERCRPQMTIWRTLIACWILKATDTYSEFVLLICFSTKTMVTRTRNDVTLYVFYCSYYQSCRLSEYITTQLGGLSFWEFSQSSVNKYASISFIISVFLSSVHVLLAN